MSIEVFDEKMEEIDFPVDERIRLEVTNGEVVCELLDRIEKDSLDFDRVKFIEDVDPDFLADFIIDYINNVYRYGYLRADEITVAKHIDKLVNVYGVKLYETEGSV